jgi:hypothetical protein
MARQNLLKRMWGEIAVRYLLSNTVDDPHAFRLTSHWTRPFDMLGAGLQSCRLGTDETAVNIAAQSQLAGC